MRRLGGFVVVSLLLLTAAAWANNELEIACEGIESGGGGVTRYQYTLRNQSAINVDVDYFYLGTTDLTVGNYSGWVAPVGFATTGTVGTYAILDSTFPITFSGMFTTGVKTPHGVVPPQTGPATPGAIVWQCTSPPCTINPGQVFTFGFENPHPSADVEWLVEQVGGISQGSSIQPMAGPLAVYTGGWVHSPVDGPGTPGSTPWGLLLAAVLVAVALAYFMKRRPSDAH